MSAPKNVLITGGCGFIGANFVNFIHFAWPNCNFVNIDKLILNSDVNYVCEEVRNSPRYEIVLADIRNRDVISRVLNSKSIDTIIHFAADCTSTRCYNEPCEALENNVIAYVQFLEAVKDYGKIEKFVHISTDEVYGDSGMGSDEIPKSEAELMYPGNPYAATKAAGEAYAHLYQQAFGIPITLLRINNIYGPQQWDVKLVPRFIDVARKQQKFTVQGTGKQLRSWLYVDDAADGIRLAAEKGKVGETYNLGTYYEKNVLELAESVQAEVDKQLNRPPSKVEFISIPDRPYNDMRYLIDITKAKKELGWEPKISFEDGLARVVASALKPHFAQKMSIAIYGGNGWIGQKIQKLLQSRKIPYKIAKSKIGIHSTKQLKKLLSKDILNFEKIIIDELNELCVTHVLCCTGRTQGGNFKTIEYLEGGSDKAYENLRDNLYCPLVLAHISQKLGLHYSYIGTGYLFAYDSEHTIGGKGFDDAGMS
uniref:NAD(P)-binding domain-containing protein n=1 Tax=Panagrolaimus davidi TaxID=227884 RepID=A0A914PK43_9BILA